MTLRDIFNAVGKNKKFWIHFDWDWEENYIGNIIPTTKAPRNLDSEVSIHYQWFHHMNVDLDTDELWKAIESHDYSVFVKWFNRLKNENLTYLPTDAQIWMGEDCIGSVVVAYDVNTFNLITSQDCECG